MAQFNSLALDGVVEIVPEKHGDARGFFSEVYNKAVYSAGGITCDFIQDNHSFSAGAGVVRGLHFQTPPFAQAKLVRVIRGAVYDVAVDIRHGSPDFGKWIGVDLSAERWNQLFIPAGFAHGFVTLTANVEFLYKVSSPYSRPHDRSILYDDPAIGIDWPLDGRTAILSDKDRDAPLLADTRTGFTYGEG